VAFSDISGSKGAWTDLNITFQAAAHLALDML
jgi:hypothetical protein